MTECRDFSMEFSLPFLGRRSGVARVHAGTANNHSGLQLFFCQPSPCVSTPISIFKTRNRSFVRPIVASIPESMFTRKK